jgi:hypothetical protein
MDFKQALVAMKQGNKVKLPSWGGYWEYDADINGIVIHCKEGNALYNYTERLLYTAENIISDEWIIANKDNTPILGGEATFSFGEAIKYLKRGFKVARKGWNGKKQYVELATCISYKNNDGDVVNIDHNNIGNKALAFVGTSGVQMGWLASQADMLADDWIFAEDNRGEK